MQYGGEGEARVRMGPQHPSFLQGVA